MLIHVFPVCTSSEIICLLSRFSFVCDLPSGNNDKSKNNILNQESLRPLKTDGTLIRDNLVITGIHLMRLNSCS